MTRRAAMAAAGVTVAATITGGLAAAGAAASTAKVPLPQIKMIAAQRSITAYSFHHRVFPDPGIWVASLRAPLEFEVQRVPYRSPIRISQVNGTDQAPLPGTVLDGWNGLKNFIHLTLRNRAGRLVASQRVTFCPNFFSPARESPPGPPVSRFPQQCASNPFEKGTVWGIQKDWAVDPFGGSGFTLAPGTYRARKR